MRWKYISLNSAISGVRCQAIFPIPPNFLDFINVVFFIVSFFFFLLNAKDNGWYSFYVASSAGLLNLALVSYCHLVKVPLVKTCCSASLQIRLGKGQIVHSIAPLFFIFYVLECLKHKQITIHHSKRSHVVISHFSQGLSLSLSLSLSVFLYS